MSETGIMLTISKEAFKDLICLIPKLASDWLSFVEILKNDKTRSDYIYGSVMAYRKTPLELLLIKFRLTVLKVLRQISIEKEN